MTDNPNFLLGRAVGLLLRVRAHLISTENTDGLALMEDEWLEIKDGLEKTYYGQSMEKSNAE